MVVLLESDSSLLKVSLQGVCWDIFCEYVCRVVVGVYFDQLHIVVLNPLLYKQMFQVNMLCFS